MVEFADAEHDVLVCTTIIESGLDIPSVNAIIIDRAGQLGLAQLYQLRGRVGRSAEKAYAYLLYKREQHLTKKARKRLQAVFEASELGAGFKIAMHDLEIRGAGNILGAAQHGHVTAVGFELYPQLLEEAVNEQPGAPRAAALPETTVDLALSTAIPDDYVPSRQRKLELYRRIAGLAMLDDLAGLREELRDRYGPPPEPVRNLLYGVEVKLRAVKAGATEVTARGPERGGRSASSPRGGLVKVWLFAVLLVLWGNLLHPYLGSTAVLPGGSWHFVLAGAALVGVSVVAARAIGLDAAALGGRRAGAFRGALIGASVAGVIAAVDVLVLRLAPSIIGQPGGYTPLEGVSADELGRHIARALPLRAVVPEEVAS